MNSSTRNILSAVLLICICSTASAAEPALPRERLSFNTGWRFAQGDPDGITNQLAYTNIQAWVEATGAEFTTNADLAARKQPDGNPGGTDVAYAQSGFDDRQWRLLNLPHDWGIEGPFKQAEHDTALSAMDFSGRQKSRRGANASAVATGRTIAEALSTKVYS